MDNCNKCGLSFKTYRPRDITAHMNMQHSARHEIVPVYMASGYQWCNGCGVNIQQWGNGWRHRAGYYPPSFYGRD